MVGIAELSDDELTALLDLFLKVEDGDPSISARGLTELLRQDMHDLAITMGVTLSPETYDRIRQIRNKRCCRK